MHKTESILLIIYDVCSLSFRENEKRKRRKKGEKETKRKDLKGDLKWVYLVNSENKTITQGLNGDSILRSINLLLKL